jgi:hypothetical protein
VILSGVIVLEVTHLLETPTLFVSDGRLTWRERGYLQATPRSPLQIRVCTYAAFGNLAERERELVTLSNLPRLNFREFDKECAHT